MTGNDWEKFGEDIKTIIQDAVQYGNYDKLNQTISNTINQAADWLGQNISGANYGEQQGNCQSRQLPELYHVNTKDKVLPAALIGGSALVGLVALLPIGLSFLEALWWFDIPVMMSLIGEAVGVFLFWLVFVFIGARGFMRISRFKRYVRRIGKAEYCNISDLADAIRKPVKYVVKDIEKMIRKGWFLQGHLDKQKTCLITTDQMYRQYEELEMRKENERIEAEKAKQKEEEIRSTLSPEVQKIIDQGDYYVRKLRECNDAIPGEEVSEKIEKIEKVVEKIFARVKQNPSSVSDIRKLMEYYLPTTVKLLEAYEEMDAQPVGGTNIQTAKKEIEDTLDTLNVAFEKLLDELFQDTAWDISTDISVLHTMLAQEGLKDDGLKTN